MITVTRELELADRIVRGLSGDGRITVAMDEEVVRCRLSRRPGWRLTEVIFSREALQRLEADPFREVKVEYLQRDIARAAQSRREYRYPRFLDEQRSDSEHRPELPRCACAG